METTATQYIDSRVRAADPAIVLNPSGTDSIDDVVLTPKAAPSIRIPEPSYETLKMADIELAANYRRRFREQDLVALAQSIEEEGLMKPVIINRTYGGKGDATDTLVAGQRRYMAHTLLEAPTIKCAVYENLSAKQVLQIQLAENLQEKIAIEERAESYWMMYLGALSMKTGMDVDELASYGTYWEGPKGRGMPKEISDQYTMTEFCKDVGKAHGRMIHYFRWQQMHTNIRKKVEKGTIKFCAAAELARIANKNVQLTFLEPDGSLAGSAMSVRRRVDMYFEDQSWFADGEYRMPVEAAKKKVNSLPRRATDALIGFAGFLRAYRELCDNLPGLRKDISESVYALNYLVSANDRRPSLDAFISQSQHYSPAVNSEKRRSLRDVIMSDKDLRKRAKGRKSGALLDRVKKRIQYLPTDLVDPDLNQPRRKFQGVDTLSKSVEVLGILQPVMVTPTEDGRYRLITGHRRTRAAKKVGLPEVPAIVVEGLSKAEILLLQHKEDTFAEVSLGDRAEAIYLNKCLLEADHHARTGKEVSLGPTALSRMMPGFGVAEIESALKFHTLPKPIKLLEERGLLKYSVAVMLRGIEDRDEAYLWAVRASLGNWTVEGTDKMLRKEKAEKECYECDLFGTSEEDKTRERIDGLGSLLVTDIVEQIGGYAVNLRLLADGFNAEDSGVARQLLTNRRFVEAYVDAKRALDEVVQAGLLPDPAEVVRKKAA
ncbi:ParB N-terminal domain-containing protein [Candidatus Woesearchaeota archaeon]|nr:ParB N-terminal domain-containing protein [Candidatus Woesearchaeota archaeon]